MQGALRAGLGGGEAGVGRLARTRPRRVLVLCAVIVALSVVDLDLTLTHLTTTGMSEANPVARLVMGLGSVWAVAAWKALTVVLCVGILIRTRWTRVSEAAAWFGVAVLMALTLRWGAYVQEKRFILERAPSAEYLASLQDEHWVRLSPGG
jgi:hypothetical protein